MYYGFGNESVVRKQIYETTNPRVRPGGGDLRTSVIFVFCFDRRGREFIRPDEIDTRDHG